MKLDTFVPAELFDAVLMSNWCFSHFVLWIAASMDCINSCVPIMPKRTRQTETEIGASPQTSELTRKKRSRVGQVDREIGQRIHLRRVEMKMAQHALGKQLGVSFQQIQKYETGINRVNARQLQEIATALGVPVSFFYEGARGSETQQEVESLLALKASFGLRLVRACMRIKRPELQRRLVALMEALAADG
jgi:transcriptional regulator with XRE-family HTH domain